MWRGDGHFWRGMILTVFISGGMPSPLNSSTAYHTAILLWVPKCYLATTQPTAACITDWLLTLVSVRFDYRCGSEKLWKQLGSPHQGDWQEAPDCSQRSALLHRTAVLSVSALRTPPGTGPAPWWVQSQLHHYDVNPITPITKAWCTQARQKRRNSIQKCCV